MNEADASNPESFPPLSTVRTAEWLGSVLAGNPDPLVERIGGKLLTALSEDELMLLGEYDFATGEGNLFNQPAFIKLIDVVSTEMQLIYGVSASARVSGSMRPDLYPTETVEIALDPSKWWPSDRCLDLASIIASKVRNMLSDLGLPGLLLAGACKATLVPGPQLIPSIGLCAAGVAILALASVPAVEEAISTFEEVGDEIIAECLCPIGDQGCEVGTIECEYGTANWYDNPRRIECVEYPNPISGCPVGTGWEQTTSCGGSTPYCIGLMPAVCAECWWTIEEFACPAGWSCNETTCVPPSP